MPFVLYSRRGCHLCEQAEDMLSSAGVDAAVIDVDVDHAACERFGLRVPVLEIDGVVALEGRFDERELVRVLAVDRRSED